MNIFKKIPSFSSAPMMVLVVSLLALALRLPLLSGSFWLDEAAQALEAIRPWQAQLELAADFQPPFFHLWLFPWQFISTAEWWLRLASLIPGILSVSILTWYFYHRLDKKAAISLGLLLTTSPLMVFYSQELRPYMLAVFWACLSLITWWELQIVQRQPGKKLLRLLALINAAGALTSYVYIFWIGGQFVTSLLVNWRNFKRQTWPIWQTCLVSGVWWLLWWPGFLKQWQVSSELRQTLPAWEEVVSLPWLKAPFLTAGKFIVGLLPLDLNWFYLLFLTTIYLLIAGSAAFYAKRSKQQKQLKSFWTITIFFISSFGIIWLFSRWTPVMEPKRLLWLQPVLYLLIVVISRQVKKMGTVIILALLVINLWSLVSYWQQPVLQRENWRNVIHQIEEMYQPSNTVVVFSFDHPFAPWRWYAQEEFPTITTSLAPLQSLEQAQQRLSAVDDYQNVIVFDYLRDLTDPNFLIDEVIQSKGFEMIEVLDDPRLGFVRFYYRQSLYAQQSTSSNGTGRLETVKYE